MLQYHFHKNVFNSFESETFGQKNYSLELNIKTDSILSESADE